jgi:hypothetical protein
MMSQNKVVVKKKRKIYKLEDLDMRDLELLAQAYALPDDHFLCLGTRGYKLIQLGLMSEELQITYAGRRYMWALQQEIKAKKKAPNSTQ